MSNGAEKTVVEAWSSKDEQTPASGERTDDAAPQTVGKPQDDSGHQAAGDHGGHGHGEPLKYVTLISEHPLKTLGGWCGCYAVFLGLAVAVMPSMYVSMTQFPFYVKGNILYERQDGLIAGREKANVVPPGLGKSNANRVYKEREVKNYILQIIYEAPDGEDIWAKNHIESIAGLEDKILKGSGKNSKAKEMKYSDYCQLVYNKSNQPIATGGFVTSPCKTPLSPIAFLWDQWMPVPYAGYPESMWAKPGSQDLNSCILPAADPSRGTNPYGADERAAALLWTMLPKGVSVDAIVNWVVGEELCEVAKVMMPSTYVVASGTCPTFHACFALIYNMCTMQIWGASRNWMWSYANVSAYYDKNKANMTRYWSTYGNPAGEFFSQKPYQVIPQGVFAPFLWARLDKAVAPHSGRQLFAEALAPWIRQVADVTFGYPVGGNKGKALMSTFYFGGPLSNIDASWTKVEQDNDGTKNADSSEQAQDFGKFVFNAYGETLWKFNEDAPNGMKITWHTVDEILDGDPMNSEYVVANVLVKDLMLLIGSFTFVFFYIAAQKCSFFLASQAMCMILIGCIPTLAIYGLILRQTFVGMLQLLSMFLIMGIGADDVFVLLDCYQADRNLDRPLKEDLSAAWTHAAKAMLCTSATTFFSFLSNARSPFPAISTFGLWCCALIVVNYVSVNTFYLSVVSVYDSYFAKKRICCAGDLPVAEKTDEEPGHEEDFSTGGANLFANKIYPVLNKGKIPILILWFLLFILYIIFAAQLQPDPDAPNILPESDPYGQWNTKVVKHFAALSNPYRIKVKVAFGIDREKPLDREGTDPVKTNEKGKVRWVDLNAGTNAEWVEMQNWLISFCTDLKDKADRKPGSNMEGLEIASKVDLGGSDAVNCPWMHFKSWCNANGHQFPVPTVVGMLTLFREYFREPQQTDPRSMNFDLWRDNVFFMDGPDGGVEAKLFTIDIKLTAQTNMLYEKGLDLTKKWQDYVEKWRGSVPGFLKNGMYVTDDYAFHWFVSQDNITSEAMSGIMTSLALSYIVLIFATGNIIVASCAITSIGSIVTAVVAFSYWCGWKLGMLEAIIFVMVIGMSVDYVVHMADAYLAAAEQDRENRTRFMLGKMGMSVLSGAVTTLGASLFMVFAQITFFQKFGLIILFTIFQSLITALFFFSAMMAAIGPQGTCGDIPFKKIWRSLRGLCGEQGSKVEPLKEAPEKVEP